MALTVTIAFLQQPIAMLQNRSKIRNNCWALQIPSHDALGTERAPKSLAELKS